MMRGHVEMCLRAMTKATGRWSDELEAYWREVERQYKCCNVMMIPQEHIPLWHARSVDQRIPIEAKPIVSVPAPVLTSATETFVDGRTREGRALKMATVGV